MPLDEKSGRLTQFVIGNQQCDFNRFFYGIFIGPSAFSAFMSKIFRPLILKKNTFTYLDDVLMQSQTKDEMFAVLKNITKYYRTKYESSLRQITFFLNTRKISWTHYREKHYNPIEITHRCNPKIPATYKQKEILRIPWNV